MSATTHFYVEEELVENIIFQEKGVDVNRIWEFGDETSKFMKVVAITEMA